jgi:uncharacterized protein YwgA
MSRRKREAILAQLADQLYQHDSWSGETHLQKASFVLEAVCGVPLGLGHVLYKYGPYSAELSDELVVMRADGLLESLSVRGYGPRLLTTEAAKTQLYARWPRTLRRYGDAIEFVATHFGNKGVAQLERLATAVWVLREMPDATAREQALRLNALKPHVSVDSAEHAVETARAWQDEFAAQAVTRRRQGTRPSSRPRRGASAASAAKRSK